MIAKQREGHNVARGRRDKGKINHKKTWQVENCADMELCVPSLHVVSGRWRINATY